MIRRALLVCLVWLVYAETPGLAQEGRLERARQEVRGNKNASSNDNNNQSGDDEDSLLGHFLGELLRHLFDPSAWNIDVSVSADNPYEPRFNHFAPYPYYEHFPGNRVPRAGQWPEELSPWDQRVQPLRWSARLSVEDGNDFDGLNRANARFLLETSSGIGLLTSWNYFHEDLAGGRNDELTLGDVNIIYSAGWGSLATLRAGLGVRTLFDHGRTDWGFNFHLGGDLMPMRPLIFSIDSDFGTVGDAGVAHGRATVGVIRRGWEIFGGYDALRIGGTTLSGPLLGVRLWF